ncbi:MAG: multiheme c-type cytochrome, partial [Bdellovibrionales bacterium]|nr:multiheme c-type cytochrome [Bdellovibrionales bacterium]
DNIYGLIQEIKKKSEVIYLDTGDMLFPTPKISDSQKMSQTFISNEMVKVMDLIGLNYFVPGEMDFALGQEHFQKSWQKSKVKLLLTNSELGHKYAYIENLPHRIYLFSVANPALYDQNIFSDPFEAIAKQLEGLDVKYSDPFLRIIVLSHGGMEFDEKLAAKFPQIDWIIGSHDQSFTRDPFEEGRTKIVQVLNRNHYLGEVKISLSKTKGADSFTLHEVHSELKKNIDPNPVTNFIEQHKKQLTEIQEKEQKEMMVHIQKKNPLKSYLSCVECHRPQVDFWSGTAHSLALGTLINQGEHKNQNCISCHSLGFRNPDGFGQFQNIIEINSATSAKQISADKETRNLEELKKAYFRDLNKIFIPLESARALEAEKRKELFQKVMDLDGQYQLSRNLGGVQCMHCHQKAEDHPFYFEGKKDVDKVSINRCLSCHSKDMAPEWYQKNEKGLPHVLDDQKAQTFLQKVSCPKSDYLSR